MFLKTVPAICFFCVSLVIPLHVSYMSLIFCIYAFLILVVGPYAPTIFDAWL